MLPDNVMSPPSESLNRRTSSTGSPERIVELRHCGSPPARPRPGRHAARGSARGLVATNHVEVTDQCELHRRVVISASVHMNVSAVVLPGEGERLSARCPFGRKPAISCGDLKADPLEGLVEESLTGSAGTRIARLPPARWILVTVAMPGPRLCSNTPSIRSGPFPTVPFRSFGCVGATTPLRTSRTSVPAAAGGEGALASVGDRSSHHQAAPPPPMTPSTKAMRTTPRRRHAGVSRSSSGARMGPLRRISRSGAGSCSEGSTRKRYATRVSRCRCRVW
jgi:hypothetical protein